MAPDFKDVNAVDTNQEFTKLSLADYKGKYVVVLFYPFDFTYVCPTELIAFSENVQKFKELGAEVIGVSTDSHFTHLAWLKTPRTEGGLGKINYPLVADISKKISKDYGVLVEQKDDPMYGAALRGLFILDKESKVRSVQINDDAVGRNVEEAIRLIQGFQFADENGEVCPANWKPGAATIKPDQIKKNEFFSKEYKDGKSAAKPKYPEDIPADSSKFWVSKINEGTGTLAPNGKSIEMHYTGTLLNGDKFDSSRDRGQTFKFTLGRGQVIKCWEQGVAQLTKGQRAILNCPPDMAYGKRAMGPIPADSTLRFDVEVINF